MHIPKFPDIFYLFIILRLRQSTIEIDLTNLYLVMRGLSSCLWSIYDGRGMMDGEGPNWISKPVEDWCLSHGVLSKMSVELQCSHCGQQDTNQTSSWHGTATTNITCKLEWLSWRKLESATMESDRKQAVGESWSENMPGSHQKADRQKQARIRT